MNTDTKKKKWTLKRWKKEVWRYCSEYNRRKDTDWRGYGRCCTCNASLHWKDGDAGHFMAGRGNAILFYDKGIHLQCKRCNISGEQYLYGMYIEKRYGRSETEKQNQMRFTTKKYTVDDYIELIEEYKKKIAALDTFETTILH